MAPGSFLDRKTIDGHNAERIFRRAFLKTISFLKNIYKFGVKVLIAPQCQS